jgi:RNA polymerase sigma-70 factor (ECF subfamily)
MPSGGRALRGLIDAGFMSLHADLVRYVRAMAGADAAEDIASQVWVEVLGRESAFRGDETALRRLAFATARRRALDERRRWWRRAVTLRPPGDRALERAAPDEPYDVGRDRAVDRIARLPRPQAEVVLLRVLAGFSAEDVAEMTGRSPGAVRVLQHRALRRLADELRNHPDGDGPL